MTTPGSPKLCTYLVVIGIYYDDEPGIEVKYMIQAFDEYTALVKAGVKAARQFREVKIREVSLLPLNQTKVIDIGTVQSKP